MTNEIIQDKLLETFSKCSLRVLWKCDLEKNDSRISSNVLIRNWVPQRNILGNERILLLIKASNCNDASRRRGGDKVHYSLLLFGRDNELTFGEFDSMTRKSTRLA